MKNFKFPFLLDENTELRLLERSHAEELFRLSHQNRNYLRQWLPWLDETRSPKDTENFIEMTKKQFAANNGFQSGIWQSSKIIGVIGFHGIDWNNQNTSIGYWIGESFQGKGVMTKACRAYINHAFHDLGLQRVEIRC